MKRRWAILWIALGLALVLRAGVRDRGVITDHLEFGRRVLHGAELYAPYLEDKPLHAPYPPGFGLLTAPFSLLPERAARFAWALLQVAALGAVGAWLLRAGRGIVSEPRRQLVLGLTALLAARYVLRDTHGGGGNGINLALSLGALGVAERGRERSAGLLLGFSLATKPTQVLLLPLLALLGRPRAAVTAVLAAAAFTGLSLLLLRHGFAPLERWLAGSWAYAQLTDVFAEPEYGFPPFTWMNQCLRCAVQRYLGEVPLEHAVVVPWFFQGLGLDASVTVWVTRLSSLGLLAATGLTAWRAQRAGPAARTAALPWLVAATLALSLLLSPISWKAHHVALIPALAFLVSLGLCGRHWVWVLLGVYVPLCLLGEELLGKGYKQTQQSLYLVTAGTVALWTAALVAARRAVAAGNPGSYRPS